MINNRQQSGRRRGRGGQRQNNNGGGRGPEGGNRIDNRARGNAAQLLEKYKTLARDAQQAGDRVLTEYYLQFADHYFRVLSETRARYEENNPSRRAQGDYAEGESGFDGDDGDEGNEEDEFDSFRQPQRAHQPQQQARPRDERPANDRNAEDRPREARPANDRVQNDRPRDDRPQNDHAQNDRPRRDYGEDRSNRAPAPEPRAETGYSEAAADPRPPRRPQARPAANGGANGRDDHDDEARLDIGVLPPAFSAPSAAPVANDGDEAPAPRRRGRPRKIVPEAPAEGS